MNKHAYAARQNATYFQCPLCAFAFGRTEKERLDAIVHFSIVEAGQKYWRNLAEDARRLFIEKHTDLPSDFDGTQESHCIAICGANVTRVRIASIKSCLAQYTKLKRFSDAFQKRHGPDTIVRLRTDLVFEARNGKGITPRELSLLAAIYSVIGRKQGPVRITQDRISRRALGYKSKAVMSIELPKRQDGAVLLSDWKIRSRIERLQVRKFFARVTYGHRLPLIAQAAEHVLAQADGKQRYLQGVTELSKAFALAVPHDSALEIRDEVGFFQGVRAVLAKSIEGGEGKKSPEELDLAVRQIVSRAISSDKVIDIFDAAGLKKPDISILSDEFLAEVQHLPQRNLAVELLQKLLNNELKIRQKKYLVQSRSFAEMLEATIRKHQNRTIEAAQVIAELIDLAKQMREGQKRGEKLGLTDDEVAFYDALETNDSAVKVLGEPTLKTIARELVSHVRKSVTIDWTLRESAQAQICVLVRRILRKYGYPPDKQEKATQTVLEQAKLLCGDWAEQI